MTQSVKIVICPGMHDPQLTQQFVQSLQTQVSTHTSQNGGHKALFSTSQLLIFPTGSAPAYSSIHILQFLQTHLISQDAGTIEPPPPILLIGFSAGVVGAIGAAWGWQQLGGRICALIALDGWGVPLYGDFPIYRLSHDYFTHWSSALLGNSSESFYASPPAPHLELWRSPARVQGRILRSESMGVEPPHSTNAALFLVTLIERHGALLSTI